MHNKIEADISMVKKLVAVSRNKQEVLKTEYSKYSRTLHETEQQLNRAETVSEVVINQVVTVINMKLLPIISIQYSANR